MTTTEYEESNKGRKQVVLFGTSADPPTGLGGHTGIVSHLSSLEGYDEIRVMPVYQHMFANKRGKQVPYEKRIEMCQLSFEGIPKVTVSDAEQVCFHKSLEQQQPSSSTASSIRVGTADVLDYLISTEPNTDFSLVLGSDTFVDLTSWKWRRSKDVVDLVGGRILVIHRTVKEEKEQTSRADGNDALKKRVDALNQELHETKQQNEYKTTNDDTNNNNNNNNKQNTVQMLVIPSLSTVSSSFVRTTMDESSLIKENNMLMPKVLDYIKKNKMYGFEKSIVGETKQMGL